MIFYSLFQRYGRNFECKKVLSAAMDPPVPTCAELPYCIIELIF